MRRSHCWHNIAKAKVFTHVQKLVLPPRQVLALDVIAAEVWRGTASGTVTNCGAPQPATLTRGRSSTKRPAPIGGDVPSTETAQPIHTFGSGGAHFGAISLPALDARILQEVRRLGRPPLEISIWDGKKLTPEEQDERASARTFARTSTSF